VQITVMKGRKPLFSFPQSACQRPLPVHVLVLVLGKRRRAVVFPSENIAAMLGASAGARSSGEVFSTGACDREQ
jgi:hypothetical protein